MAEKKAATHEDANLVLRLYELRREEKMRKARDWFAFKFFPETLEDIQALNSKPGDENAYFRMVTSYWDMAASFAVSGALSADLLLASGHELIMVWTKMEKFVPQIREQAGVFDYLANVEKVIQMVDWAPERVRWLRERLPAFRKQFDQQQGG